MSHSTTQRKLYDPPQVGKDILSFCGKCKLELAHVIVSMLDSRPAKVTCKTCRSQHAYKRGGPSRGRTLTSSTEPRTRSKVTASELWQQKMTEFKSNTPLSYRGSDTYVVGTVISHSKFGLGVVEEVRSGKVTILFREGDKVLVHSQKNHVT